MVKPGSWRWVGITLVIVGLCSAPLLAQSQAESSQKPAASPPQAGDQSQPAADQDQQNIPDAPSASRPAPTFPGGKPSPSAQPGTAPPAPVPPITTPVEQPPANTPPPHPEITTVPAGSVPDTSSSSRDQLYTYTTNVNFVVVPVTVKDDSGHLVPGLLSKDFSVYENGVKQTVKFFTADPFPLSAAVIIDTGVPNVAFRKVKESLTALE